jgi:hypothetical protein
MSRDAVVWQPILAAGKIARRTRFPHGSFLVAKLASGLNQRPSYTEARRAHHAAARSTARVA